MLKVYLTQKGAVKMNLAGRINSFVFQKEKDLFQTIEEYKTIDGITHLEFNYPEHLNNYDISKIKETVGNKLKVNGISMRFKDAFVNGEFSNPNQEIAKTAIQYCKKAADICRELNGTYVTIWQAYDAFDYPFQIDYDTAWKKMIKAFQEIADYAPDIKFSIEYKPFEPRNFALLDSVGTTLFAIKEINRPNVGITLDFCHMLMKHDNPAYSIYLAIKENKLFGMHLNDGYGSMDSGLIFGSINFSQCLETIYYLKKYQYDGVLFFDSFPVREPARTEIETNIEWVRKLEYLIEKTSMEEIERVINKHDAVAVQKFILSLLH